MLGHKMCNYLHFILAITLLPSLEAEGSSVFRILMVIDVDVNY
jgi:hypothetical protein